MKMTALLLALALGCGTSHQTHRNLTGNWTGMLTTHDITLLDFSAILRQQRQAVTGTIVRFNPNQCIPAGEPPNIHGERDFDALKLEVPASAGIVLRMTGTVEDERIRGTYEFIGGGCDRITGDFLMERTGPAQSDGF